MHNKAVWKTKPFQAIRHNGRRSRQWMKGEKTCTVNAENWACWYEHHICITFLWNSLMLSMILREKTQLSDSDAIRSKGTWRTIAESQEVCSINCFMCGLIATDSTTHGSGNTRSSACTVNQMFFYEGCREFPAPKAHNELITRSLGWEDNHEMEFLLFSSLSAVLPENKLCIIE